MVYNENTEKKGRLSMQLKDRVFNFLGDSITEGCRVSALDKIYHQLIAQAYGMCLARNYGVGGTCIAPHIGPGAHGPEFERRVEAMEHDADAVVVFGGTNDFGLGDAPFGTLDSEDKRTFCGAVNSLILKLKREFPKAEIVFMTPLHRLNEDIPSPRSGKTLAEYVEAERLVCERHGIPVIDLFGINPLDPADESLLPDGLHPNDSGHVIMARVIAEELLKI